MWKGYELHLALALQLNSPGVLDSKVTTAVPILMVG